MMSSSATSSQRPTFNKPHHFKQSTNADNWFCNICAPNTGHRNHMSRRTAMLHERNSAAHARNVSETEIWWSPPAQDAAAWDAPLEEDPPMTIEEMKEREGRLHVDHVQDMVPFWIRGVQAAEHGEVPRLEKFLETLQQDSWINVDPWKTGDPWKYAYSAGEWGHLGQISPEAVNGRKAVWGRRHDKATSSMHGHRTRTDSQTREVEYPRRKNSKRKVKARGRRVVNQDGNDAYAFVEDIARQEAADAERKRKMHIFFEMPTQDKIRKIDEVIDYLRSIHH